VLTKVDRIKQEKDILAKTDAIVKTVIDKGLTMCNPVVHLVSSHTSFGLKELKSDAVFIYDQPKLS